MAKRYFNKDLRPHLAAIISDIEAALSRRGCALVEIYLTGGYGRALSQAAAEGSPMNAQELIARAKKTRGDVDILVGYRALHEGTEIDADDVARDVNDGAHMGGPDGKDFLIDYMDFGRAHNSSLHGGEGLPEIGIPHRRAYWVINCCAYRQVGSIGPVCVCVCQNCISRISAAERERVV